MKIIQLVTKRQYRGAEVFAAALSSALQERGHEVLFVGLYPPPDNVLTASNSRNIDLNGNKRAFSWSLLFQLVKLVRSEKPDIIQANGSDTLKYAVLTKLLVPGTNIIYRNISMVSAWVKKYGVKKWFNRFLFSRVNRVTSVGQQSLNDLLATYDYPQNKARLIRRGIPYLEYDPVAIRQQLATQYGFETTDPILVHVGQFSTEKNHPFLLESFKKVVAIHPNVKLLLIGEGKNMSVTRQLVADHQLENNIIFTGHKENVQEILAGCDIFILGSTVEGVPGAILEAALQGLPSVAVKVGGVGEVVINGKTGILIDKHDPSDFSIALIHLIEHSTFRKFLGQGARDFVYEQYGLQHCAEEFIQLYEESLAD